MVLPDGFGLPPVPYLLSLLVATVAVVALLVRQRPAVRESTVLAFVPWMIAGASAHVLDAVGTAPSVIVPLLGTPSVYISTFVLAGLVWGLTNERGLAVAGTLVALLSVGAVLVAGDRYGTIALFWPVLALVISIVLTAGTWALFRRALPNAAETTAVVGVLVVFGHVLDGISTAIGIDVLEVHERSPLPRAIMDFADTLPTAELIGVGWLFVLVKLALACGIIWLMTEYVEEAPSEGFLLLALIAAVGLGPGVHNLLLFAIGG